MSSVNDSSSNDQNNKKNITDESSDVKINQLNDHVLEYIFQFLTIPDKLNIEAVCKKWNEVSKSSWRYVKSINVSDNGMIFNNYTYKSDSTEKNNIFLHNVLKRSSNYLEKVVLHFSKSVKYNYALFLENLANESNSVLDFTISGSLLETRSNLKYDNIDVSLRKLFENNEKLSKVSLESVTFSGKCLCTLKNLLLEELSFALCEFNYAYLKHLSHFNLKNLKLVKLYFNDVSLEKEVIRVLKQSNCKLDKFVLVRRPLLQKFHDYKLAELFKNQNELKSVVVPNFPIDKESLKRLPYDNIKELSIEFDEYLLHLICNFKNLITLSLKGDDFSDECVKIICMCKNLKNLNILVMDDYDTEYELSNNAIKCFGELQDLENFELSICDGKFDADYFLKTLSNCKKLTTISLPKCNATDIGLQAITLLPNLTKIHVTKSDLTNEGVLNLIKNCLKLEEIDVSSCISITNNLIVLASEFKDNCTHKQILRIFHYNTQINSACLEKKSEFIELINAEAL